MSGKWEHTTAWWASGSGGAPAPEGFAWWVWHEHGQILAYRLASEADPDEGIIGEIIRGPHDPPMIEAWSAPGVTEHHYTPVPVARALLKHWGFL